MCNAETQMKVPRRITPNLFLTALVHGPVFQSKFVFGLLFKRFLEALFSCLEVIGLRKYCENILGYGMHTLFFYTGPRKCIIDQNVAFMRVTLMFAMSSYHNDLCLA